MVSYTFKMKLITIVLVIFILVVSFLVFRPREQIIQIVTSYMPFYPETSVIQKFKSDTYITAPLTIKIWYEEDGIVFMDYVTKDNFLMVLIRNKKPVIRFNYEGDIHVVTLKRTQSLILNVMEDSSDQIQVQGYNYNSKSVENKTIQAPFKRLSSHIMRLGNSAPKSIRYGELNKSFTGKLYWIRYVDNYIGSELL